MNESVLEKDEFRVQPPIFGWCSGHWTNEIAGGRSLTILGSPTHSRKWNRSLMFKRGEPFWTTGCMSLLEHRMKISMLQGPRYRRITTSTLSEICHSDGCIDEHEGTTQQVLIENETLLHSQEHSLKSESSNRTRFSSENLGISLSR